jgi:DNA-directed RNA polymerase subunit N (RpoN/RPB10)
MGGGGCKPTVLKERGHFEDLEAKSKWRSFVKTARATGYKKGDIRDDLGNYQLDKRRLLIAYVHTHTHTHIAISSTHN